MTASHGITPTDILKYNYSLIVETSSKVLEADLEALRKDILKYKTEYYRSRDRLDKLVTSYEDSKKHGPTKRYDILKEMIKEATRDIET